MQCLLLFNPICEEYDWAQSNYANPISHNYRVIQYSQGNMDNIYIPESCNTSPSITILMVFEYLLENCISFYPPDYQFIEWGKFIFHFLVIMARAQYHIFWFIEFIFLHKYWITICKNHQYMFAAQIRFYVNIFIA